MNWRKNKTLQYEGSIYNMELWLQISVMEGVIGNTKEEQKILKIVFPDTDGSPTCLYANRSYCKTHNMDMLLGLDAGTVESLFLAAECSD